MCVLLHSHIHTVSIQVDIISKGEPGRLCRINFSILLFCAIGDTFDLLETNQSIRRSVVLNFSSW